MATRKSKTIRANPLDAISSVSMEKVNAPIKSIRIKKTPVPESQPVAASPAESIVPDRDIKPKKRTTPRLSQPKSKVLSKRSGSTAKPSLDSAPHVQEITPQAANTPDHDRSGEKFNPNVSHDSRIKKCAEDVFEEELRALPASNKKSVLPELPHEAFSEITNDNAAIVIKQWAQWSAVGSMVTVPFVGTVLISAAQIKMIHSLCKNYGVPFERNLAVAVATGLVGGGVAAGLAELLGRFAIKSVPFVGPAFTIAVEPALSYASSYAIGMSFVKHFEAGGTLADFNAREMKSYFSENVTRCLAYFRDRKKSIFASKSPQ